tara:strand:- start:1932 stop:2918 length:987 start_codon:yes stop_codon:yes gene_type:complete
MIDIVILAEEINTEFTLASLLNKSENFRLHIFHRHGLLQEKMEPTLKWAMQNFREVYSYTAPYKYRGEGSQRLARTILQFKEHWKDKQPKGLPIERVIVHTRGARLFNGKFAGNVPTVKQMGNKVAFLSRKFQYFDHPFYGNYYDILNLDAKKDYFEEDFILLNWHRFKDVENSHFFINGKARRFGNEDRTGMLRDVDSFILSADTKILLENIKNKMEHGWMPLYFDMTCDTLMKKEAIGPKDTINHNIMMRKAFSVNADTTDLWQGYHQLPTLHYMAFPWDMWTAVIDDIPLNLRREGLNERLLVKADHQKRYLRKVVEAGYLLGKI